MGLREARRYIEELRKRQKDPYLWPDFLTGLPDRSAVLAELNKVYPRLGKLAVSYIIISGINPYLIKYGSGRHMEAIQWAAAALKTSADARGGFVGAYGYDFIAVADVKTIDGLLSEAADVFAGKTRTFYRKEDVSRGKIISYKNGGKKVEHGLMKLVYSTLREKAPVPINQLIPCLQELIAEP